MLKRLKAVWMAFLIPESVKIKDSLTGGLDKSAFQRAASREFNRAQRQDRLSILVFIDIDGLKKINDKYGHHAGDDHLKKFANKMLKHIRSFDLLARWGGDEFVLFLSTTEEAVEKILSRMYSSFPHFSWGTSVWQREEDFDIALKKADERMYEMKKGKAELGF